MAVRWPWKRPRLSLDEIPVAWPSPVPGGVLLIGASEVETLARYSAERERGLVHTPEWQEKMADLQARYDMARKGWWP